MKNVNEIPARGTIYALTAIIVVLAIGLAVVAHADDRSRKEGPDRTTHTSENRLSGVSAHMTDMGDRTQHLSESRR